MLSLLFWEYVTTSSICRKINAFLNPEIEPRSQLSLLLMPLTMVGYLDLVERVYVGITRRSYDFIIAVAAEEFGAILCLLIILFFCLITRSFLLKKTKIFY